MEEAKRHTGRTPDRDTQKIDTRARGKQAHLSDRPDAPDIPVSKRRGIAGIKEADYPAAGTN